MNTPMQRFFGASSGAESPRMSTPMRRTGAFLSRGKHRLSSLPSLFSHLFLPFSGVPGHVSARGLRPASDVVSSAGQASGPADPPLSRGRRAFFGGVSSGRGAKRGPPCGLASLRFRRFFGGRLAPCWGRLVPTRPPGRAPAPQPSLVQNGRPNIGVLGCPLAARQLPPWPISPARWLQVLILPRTG